MVEQKFFEFVSGYMTAEAVSLGLPHNSEVYRDLRNYTTVQTNWASSERIPRRPGPERRRLAIKAAYALQRHNLNNAHHPLVAALFK